MENIIDKEQMESEKFFKELTPNLEKTEKKLLHAVCIAGSILLSAAAVLVGQHTHALNTIRKNDRQNNG